MIEGLPWSWPEAFTDDSVILEDEEKAALSYRVGFKCSVHVSLSWPVSIVVFKLWGYDRHLCLPLISIGGNQVLEQLVHVKMSLHRHVGCGEHERRRFLEDACMGKYHISK